MRQGFLFSSADNGNQIVNGMEHLAYKERLEGVSHVMQGVQKLATENPLFQNSRTWGHPVN